MPICQISSCRYTQWDFIELVDAQWHRCNEENPRTAVLRTLRQEMYAAWAVRGCDAKKRGVDFAVAQHPDRYRRAGCRLQHDLAHARRHNAPITAAILSLLRREIHSQDWAASRPRLRDRGADGHPVTDSPRRAGSL